MITGMPSCPPISCLTRWLSFGLFLLYSTFASGLDNGLGLRPPMGYSSWNHLKCEGMHEKAIRAIADAMVSKGLKALGFEYVNLDDCWAASDRDASGRLQAHPEKFPSGMRAMGEYIHSKGLKFGIYTDRGTWMCSGTAPGSQGYERLDAETFAEWGVDYVKEDNCYNDAPAMWLPESQDRAFEQFGLFRDALNATGRPMFFNVCGAGWRIPFISDLSNYAKDPRGGAALGNSWRIAADCMDWLTCQVAMNIVGELSAYAGPGGFNDADLLLGSSSHAGYYLSQEQSRTQFNVLVVTMAPLLISSPVAEYDDGSYDLTTYLNEEVIAVNQDPMMKPGFKIHDQTSLSNVFRAQVWMRELSGGAFAFVFLNSYPWSTTVVCDATCWSHVPVQKGTVFAVRDLWLHGPAQNVRAVAGADYSVQLDAHGASKMFKLTPRAVSLGKRGDELEQQAFVNLI